MASVTTQGEFITWLESQVGAEETLEQLAIETGFQQRKPRKIPAGEFLALLCWESIRGAPSYNDLASRMTTTRNITASKQAYQKRVNESGVAFFQTILATLIISNSCERAKTLRANTRYARILVQDSTVVRLPQRLFAEFSGVSNGHTSVCNARIQGVYDLLAGAFVSFSIDAYSKNDLCAAPELELRQGDLVLRDRGYLSCAEIARHQAAGADCIYRHKHGTKYLDPDTGAPIPLAKILESAGCLDREVCLNDERQTRVRLVAMPVGEEVANLRRMKAKKEMKGHRPSAELLRLLSWSIFVTTIPAEKASFVELLAIYGLRWRIESIFKAWKGQMNFSAVHQVSGSQLRMLLTARLIMIVLTFHCLFNPLRERIRQRCGRDLSLLKFMRYLLINQEQYGVIVRALAGVGAAEIYLAIARYCTYDKRKGRLNYAQTEAQVFAAIA